VRGVSGSGDVLALDKALLSQACAKSDQEVCDRLRRSLSQKPDHRHRRLLRTPRERPDGGRAAEQRDELASPHGHSLGARITPYHVVEKAVLCASEHFGSADYGVGHSARSLWPEKFSPCLFRNAAQLVAVSKLTTAQLALQHFEKSLAFLF